MLLFLVLLFYITGKFISGHFILEVSVKNYIIPLFQFRKKKSLKVKIFERGKKLIIACSMC